MKSFFKAVALIVFVIIWTGCSGDYRQKAVGAFSEVAVIMDSTQFNSQTAQALRETYGQFITTIPRPEPKFDLHFYDFKNNDQLDQLKKYKNIIIAAPINDSTNASRLVRAMLSDEIEQKVRNGEIFAFPLKDKWYRDQWTMILTAPSDSALAEQIENSSVTLTDNLMKKEMARWKAEIYERGEQKELEDSLWANHGWKMDIQHDWLKHIDTTYTHNGAKNHFLTMRRPLPENDRWFWAWWQDDVNNVNFMDDDWINAKRDSLLEKWIRGTRDSSYVITEYRRPVNKRSFKLNDNIANETLGTWQMTNDAMGGPFAALTIFDDKTNRLFILEFDQFAPKYEKRRFVRQFRVMLRTFESDSSWNTKSQKTTKEN